MTYEYDINDSNHGALVISWYLRMIIDGELYTTFTKKMSSIQLFLDLFKQAELRFAVDEQGIFLAVWTSPCLQGAFFSLYVRPDVRRTMSAYKCAIEEYERALAHYPLLLGITKQKRLLAPHKRIGYTIEATLPGIWDGDDAYLVVLQRGNLRHGKKV